MQKKLTKEFKNPISERLSSKIQERGYTTYELCKKAGYAAGSVHVAKQRENSFSTAKMLYDFAQILGVTTDYLISGNETAIDRDQLIKTLINEKIEYKAKYEELLAKVNLLLNSITINTK